MTPAQRARLGYNTYSDLDIPGTSTDIMYMTQFVLKLDLEEVLGKTSPSGLATLAVVSEHGYSRLRQPIYCAKRSPYRAEQQSLGHTPMEQKIDKRMAAYSNKFSAPGIISDLTDVDTDVLTQCICSELRVVNYYKDRQHIDIKSARNLESVESFIDDMELK
ncbi:hypothetical protein D6C93_07624 [Aureobasidium pullulans]|nr:hypothetical protein D6C93_07624 [Aureobasidium pullulans]